MELISDFLLLSGALGSGFYCMVLSKRLRRLTDLETGIGGAIAALNAQVDDLTVSVLAAQDTAKTSVANLDDVSARAEDAARHLELLVASMHDLPKAPANPFRARAASSQAAAS